MACSVLNSCAASALASSVLPTPVGPRNRKDAIGPLGSFMPALHTHTDKGVSTAHHCRQKHAVKPTLESAGRRYIQQQHMQDSTKQHMQDAHPAQTMKLAQTVEFAQTSSVTGSKRSHTKTGGDVSHLLRCMASDTATTASSCPMILRCSSSPRFSRRLASLSTSFVSGMPAQRNNGNLLNVSTQVY